MAPDQVSDVGDLDEVEVVLDGVWKLAYMGWRICRGLRQPAEGLQDYDIKLLHKAKVGPPRISKLLQLLALGLLVVLAIYPKA